MKRFNLVAVLFLVSLAACASRESASYSNSNASASYATPDQRSVSSTSTANTAMNSAGGGKQSPVAQQVSLAQAETTQSEPTTVERKIIRNADLQLETDAPEEAQQKITQIAESAKGFVVESRQSSSETRATRDTVTMTVRVPAEKFDDALSQIRQTASRVIDETVKGDDVTEEFIDLEARLKTQKALEAQFLEIMKQARTVEDALKVQREIADVRTEIEKVEGRKKFLENQASFSTIKLQIQTPAAISNNSKGFFHRLGESFGGGFDAALSFILIFVQIIIAILPFLILVVLPVYLVIRYLLRRQRRRNSASEIAREEIKTS